MNEVARNRRRLINGLHDVLCDCVSSEALYDSDFFTELHNTVTGGIWSTDDLPSYVFWRVYNGSE